MKTVSLPECIAVELWPVGDRPIECAHVDEIKVVFRMYPGFFHIIDLELEIGWHKVRLDWG